MPGGGHPIDRTTQAWVRATGRRVVLAEHPWLDGPVGDPLIIGDEWVSREARRLGGTVRQGGGLLARMAALDGEDFDSQQVAPEVLTFYEQTTQWRLDVWSQWCAAAWPFGWALGELFARRLQQLSLPLRPLDVAQGMDSRVLAVVGHDGEQLGAAWLRSLRANGQTIYSGWYGTTQLPLAGGPSIRVMFPLPNGSVAVFLRPTIDDGGAFRLTSPLADFGDDGAYLIVACHDDETAWVRRVPLAERFSVYVDEEGVLRTDHALDLWAIPVIRLHYRLERTPRSVGNA